MSIHALKGLKNIDFLIISSRHFITQILEEITQYMGSVLLPAIGIAVATALLGSVAFSFFAPESEISPLLALEEKCEKIALEGYKMHLKYTESQPTDLPTDDMNRLLSLDAIWINDCVNGLPAATVFDIIQRVELNSRSGE